MTTALEQAEGALYGAPLHSIIGDTISYKPASGSFGPIEGFVDYGDQAMSYDGAQVIAQDIKVEIAKAAVPAKPDSTCQLQLPKAPGLMFKPVNIGTDPSGNCWVFAVVTVNA